MVKLIDIHPWKARAFNRFLGTSYFAFSSAIGLLIMTLFQDDYKVTHYRIYDSFNDRYFWLVVSFGVMFAFAFFLRYKMRPFNPREVPSTRSYIFLYVVALAQIAFGVYCLLLTFDCLYYGFGRTDFQ